MANIKVDGNFPEVKWKREKRRNRLSSVKYAKN
jgi:hypothetical protein